MKKILAMMVVLMAVTAGFAQARQSLLRSANARPVGRPAAPAAEMQPEAVDAEAAELHFKETPLDMVFEVYGKLVDKTILKDPACPNCSITLESRPGQKLTLEERVSAIEAMLEMNKVHLEPYGEKFIRATKREDSRKEGIPIIMDPEQKLEESMKVVSMMIPFKNIGVEEAQKALEGFKSGAGLLQVFERTNSILVTDTQQNINRMIEISKAIDIATPVMENVFVRQIKNASASEIKTALEAIVQDSQKELEKQKGATNAQNPNNAFNNGGMNRPGGLLRRPGQPQQPQQPENIASLVTSVSDADRGMIRGKVLILADERSNKLVVITSKANMDFFDKVIEQLDVETTPDTVVKVYRLKYADAEDVSDMINDLIGNSGSSKSSAKNNQNANSKVGAGGNLTRSTPAATAAKQPANKRAGEAKAGELSKDNTTVLADKRINGLVVMTDKELVPVLEQIIESMDVKLSQVLIETVIIEVTLGDDLKTGIDWVRNGRFDGGQHRNKDGQFLYWDVDTETGKRNGLTTTDSTWTDSEGTVRKLDAVMDLVKDTFWSGNAGLASAMGGGGSIMSDGGKAAAEIVTGAATNLFGSAFNYIFKSDKLNLSAIVKASKTDNRSKYLASPIVMTVDNKEATIDATESRKFFSGYETSSSYSTYMRTPKYDSKDIGIQIKVTPKINPNGTVMLNVEEEYSQVVEGGQSILVGEGSATASIDTALQRKMSADVVLENRQTVILCGLTETSKSESETGIPILKDIPWIGKWLFGSVKKTEARKELLIFMTPYVLDDGEAAQAEAIRRKKTLSDASPWEDHGWSSSELADPVSKGELLRRLKDEWKKQDEERKTRIAIEEAKVERAKKLKEMTEAERDLWLEKHKDELEEEQREELEEKMQDPKSQEELQKLAAEIREKKLREAAAAQKISEDAEKKSAEEAEAIEKSVR